MRSAAPGPLNPLMQRNAGKGLFGHLGVLPMPHGHLRLASSSSSLSTSFFRRKGLRPKLDLRQSEFSQGMLLNSQAIPRNNPIASGVLIPPMPINKLSRPIHLKTSKDILGIRYPTEVWWMPLIVDVDIATSSTTASTTLATRSPSAVSPCPTPAAVRCPPSLLLLLWEESSAGAKT